MLKEILQKAVLAYENGNAIYIDLAFISMVLIILAELIRLRKRNPYKIRKNELNEKYLVKQYTQTEWLGEQYWTQYKKLRYLLRDRNVVIVPMVDVLALVQPRIYLPNREALIRKLAGQHIDFMVCTETMKPIALIRLLNHSRQKGQERIDDIYATTVLSVAGYDVRCTSDITEDTIKNI